MNNEFFLDFSAALPEDAAEDQVINNYSLCLTCKPLPNHHNNPRFNLIGSMKVYLTLRSKKITQLANLSLQSMLFLRKMERYGALWSIYDYCHKEFVKYWTSIWTTHHMLFLVFPFDFMD